MADKQIIIDGVDVSACRQYMHRYMEDYDIDTLDYCRYHFKPCKDVDVKYCYFKQLKRKEQECEELKKERDTLNTTRNKLLDDLWVVEENLKDYMEHFNKASDELDQLKQTLTEIKEITEECCYKCNSMNNCNISCKYYNNCNGEFSYLLAYLNKQISKCEV